MRRGTTPTLKFITEQDWTGYDIILTLQEKDGAELNFSNDRLKVEGTIVYLELTQEETLKFEKRINVQIKGEKDGIVIATNIEKIKVSPILNEEVM
ncbi:hypothetical protein AALA22_08780 [Anaerovoracaceae bacterium 41-7]